MRTDAFRWFRVLPKLARTAFVAVGLLGAVSCQNDSPEGPTEQGPQLYRTDLPAILDDWAQPDRAVLHAGDDSAAQEITTSVRGVQIKLDAPPADTAILSLSRGDVWIHDLEYVYDGSSTLRYTQKHRSNALALAIFARIHPASSHEAFVSEFARLLVSNDSLVRTLGFPSRGIPGVDSAEVLREAMKIVVASGKPLAAFVPSSGTWALGLDTADVRTRVRGLVQQGAVSADTSKLFERPVPPDTTGPAVRFQSPGLDTVISNADDRIDVRVFALDPSGVDSVWIDGQIATKDGGSWLATGIRIPVSDLGYRLVARARDAKGNVSTASIVVVRKATEPPAQPSLVLLQPVDGQVFGLDSNSVLVRWKVQDPRAEVIRVEIGDARADLESQNVWACRIGLPAAGKTLIVPLLAINAAGDSSRSFFRLVRATDSTSPSIVVLSPVDRTAFGYDVPVVLVRARVNVVSGIDSVKINGRLADVSALDTFALSLSLEAGRTTEILVEAWGKNGRTSRSILNVSRQGPPDTSAPRIELLAPNASGAVVPVETNRYLLKWRVTDLVEISDTGVRIEGMVAHRSLDTFSLEVSAPEVGKERAYRIEAVNAKGKMSFATVTLKRASDQSSPSLERQVGTTDTTVSDSTSTYRLAWKVTDNRPLAWVTINGAQVGSQGDLYTLNSPLQAGPNRFVVLARDSAGNTATDTVTVTRAEVARDTIRPVLTRQPGTLDTTVDNSIGMYVVGWAVTDNRALKSVWINGYVVPGNARSLYSQTVALAPGRNWITISAFDSAGNDRFDTVMITRRAAVLRDTIPPVAVRQLGTSDMRVPYRTTTWPIGWQVSDDVALDTVLINGVEVPGVAGVFARTVPLLVGFNRFVLVATDTSGNRTTDTIVIERVASPRDTIPPVAVRQLGTSSMIVPNGTTSWPIGWQVTDNEVLDTVLINGVAVPGASGVFARTVSLAVGFNRFVLVATDTSGNRTMDTIVIERVASPRDTIPPVVVRQLGTSDQVVPYGTTSWSIGWQVTDNEALDTVRINGVAVPGASGVFARTVPLAVGFNRFVLLATDTSGNRTTDTIVIERVAAPRDTIPPVVVRVSPAGLSTTVPNSTAAMTLQWTVTDNRAMGPVSVNGTTLPRAVGGAYSQTVSLAVGTNRFILVAADTSGNRTADTVVITRAADAIAPILTVVAPVGDSVVVANGTSSYLIRWTATDDQGLKSVTCNGAALSLGTGDYSVVVALVEGRNEITLQAVDTSNNIATRTVLVTRLAAAI